MKKLKSIVEYIVFVLFSVVFPVVFIALDGADIANAHGNKGYMAISVGVLVVWAFVVFINLKRQELRGWLSGFDECRQAATGILDNAIAGMEAAVKDKEAAARKKPAKPTRKEK